VTAKQMLEFLIEFHRDKAVLRQAHEASSRFVRDYNINNTYQYVIAREDMHVRWVEDAIVDHGAPVPDVPAPEVNPHGKGAAAQEWVIRADRDAADQFVAKWRPRVDALPNARNRTMLNVILGETLEQKRFFEQALEGREDLLGRRADGMGTPGKVLPTRWVE
jgi:hypothetical protein